MRGSSMEGSRDTFPYTASRFLSRTPKSFARVLASDKHRDAEVGSGVAEPQL